MKFNGKNERIKRTYARYLKAARRLGEASIDAGLAAIDRFEIYTKRRDFAQFHIEQAIAFKDHLAAQFNKRTGKPLSLSTQLHTLEALRAFINWLADQSGYRSRIRHSDADYFSLSLKHTAVARAHRPVEGPTIEQVRYVIEHMRSDTDLRTRNRAVIACAILTGARDDALASLRLKHIDLQERMLRQDAASVRTKASKTIETWFFPVGDFFVDVMADWVRFLKDERQWGLDDPLFPRTKMARGEGGLNRPAGLDRVCWSNAGPIRKIFRDAFEAAGLPYFNPHSLRKTLARLGLERCRTAEEFKAWSQNFGHNDVLTTFTSYGQVDRRRQGEIICGLWKPEHADGSEREMLVRSAIEFALSQPHRRWHQGMKCRFDFSLGGYPVATFQTEQSPHSLGGGK